MRKEEAEQRRWEADREERQRKELVEDERRQTEMQQQAELFAQRHVCLIARRPEIEPRRQDAIVPFGRAYYLVTR